MITIETIITIISACGILLAGQRFYLIDTKDRLNQAFFLLAGLLSWMSFAWFEMSQTVALEEALFYKRLIGIWPVSIFMVLYCTWRYAGMHEKGIPDWGIKAVGGAALAGALYFSYLDIFTSNTHGELSLMKSDMWGISMTKLSLTDWLRGIWLFCCLFASILFTYMKYLDATTGLSGKKWPVAAFLGVTISLVAVFCAIWLVPATGQRFPFNLSFMAFLGVVVFGLVYSDLKLLEIKPEASFENIGNIMTNTLIMTNMNFQVQHLNEAACSMFGVKQQGATNENINRVLGLENEGDWLKEVQLTLENGDMKDKYICELELNVKDKQVVLSLIVSPAYNRLGKKAGYVFLGTDITDCKKSEQKLKDYAHNLKKSNHALERFAYIASHDLKEPVRTAGGFLTLLERRLQPILDKDTRGYFEYIKESITRLNTLLETTRTVSKYSDLIINPVELNTRIVVGKIIRRLGRLIEDKNATVHYNNLPMVKADEKHLDMLFQNLIENGLKYNESDAPQVRITCCTLENGWFEFSVSDNGIGIDPEFQNQIFHMFKRLHNRSKYQGSGIGLAICQQIVEKHRGKIWVESNEGEGAVFKFTLPGIEESTQSAFIPARQMSG